MYCENYKITDLFHREIDYNNIPSIILLHITLNDEINKILNPIYENFVFDIDNDILTNILNEYELKNFNKTGQIILLKNKTNLIYPLINTNKIGKIADKNDFKKLYKLNNNLNVWISYNKNYSSIGCVISKNEPDDKIVMIDNDLLINYKSNIFHKNDLSTNNEFNLLGNKKKIDPFTINRIKFITDNMNESGYLINKNNYHISITNNNSELNLSKTGKKYIITYTKDGLLLIDRYCLFVKKNRLNLKNEIILNEPKNSLCNKWIPIYNNNHIMYISMLSNKALFYDNKNKLIDEEPSNNTFWKFVRKSDDTEVLDNISWITQVDKNISLSVPSNPWFVNRKLLLSNVLQQENNNIYDNKYNNKYDNKYNQEDENKRKIKYIKYKTKKDNQRSNDKFWFWIKTILTLIIFITVLSFFYRLIN